MAYCEELTSQMRTALHRRLGDEIDRLEEKRMMGGMCFMFRGNMVGGADRTKEGERRFMFRCGKGNEAAAALPGGQVMEMGGRVMSGLYFVDADRCDDALLGRWSDVALEFARSLPAK